MLRNLINSGLSPFAFLKVGNATNKGGRKDLPSVFISEYSSFVFIRNDIRQLLDPLAGQRSTEPLSRGVCPLFHISAAIKRSFFPFSLKKGRLLAG